jgi:hypothetical protein
MRLDPFFLTFRKGMSSIMLREDSCGIRDRGEVFVTMQKRRCRGEKQASIRRNRGTGALSSQRKLGLPCVPVRGRQGDREALADDMVWLVASGVLTS